MVRSVQLGELLAEAASLIRTHRGLLITAIMAITAFDTFTDWHSAATDNQEALSWLYFVASLLVTMVIQYWATQALLAERVQASETRQRKRYGALLVTSVCCGIGILLGMVLLVVPGLYLAGRWLTASVRVVEGHSANQAIKLSWADSERSQLAFSLAALIGMTPVVVALALFASAAFFGVGIDDADGVLGFVITNLLTALGTVMTWVIATAAFRFADPPASVLGKVFA